MKYELYEVGGKIRDEFLNVHSNDVDYSVVLGDIDKPLSVAFIEFQEQLESEGFDIKTTKIETVTIRALFPKDHQYSGVADFVLARKELYYPETGRQPVVKLGTLEDDLFRRDFTLNSMAKDKSGEIVDLYDGYRDLMEGILRTPGDPRKSFKDDPLRIIRAMRFCITKGFVLSIELREAIKEIGMHGIEKVSTERVSKELNKCFRFSTPLTLEYLSYFKTELNFDLISYAFGGTGLWLEPTNKKP